MSVGSQDSKADLKITICRSKWCQDNGKIMEIIHWLPISISLVSAEGRDTDFKVGLWVAKSKHEKKVRYPGRHSPCKWYEI